MSFVYEDIAVEDVEFLRTRGFKNCWGSNQKPFGTIDEFWSVNKEKNAYMIEIGGGMHEVPLIFDLWWDGHICRGEYHEGGTTEDNTGGINIVRNVTRILIPEKLWDKRDEIVELIRQGFSVMYWGTREERTKSITVNIKCQPTLAGKGDVYGE